MSGGGVAFKIVSPDGEVLYVPFGRIGDPGRRQRVVEGTDWVVEGEPIELSDGIDYSGLESHDYGSVFLAWDRLP